MADKVKWGVIGSGGIARRRTIPEGIVAADNSELVFVYDIASAVNAEVAKEFRATAVDSVETLLAGDIDAVYVATPLNVHCEQVIACAKAGKHVLCEKPLGMNVAEAETMIDACNSAGVLLGTGLGKRFVAQHQALLEMINDGKLGKLTYGRAQLSCWYPPMDGAWRQIPAQGGGGSLMDMGSHCIDMLEMLFGKLKKVSCFINNTVHDYEPEDSAIVSLFFENGAMATVDAFFCIPDESSKNILEVYGSKGSVLARETLGQDDHGEMVAYLKEDDGGYNAQQGRSEVGGIVIAPQPVNPFMAEVEEFAAAITEGRKPCNGYDIGLQSQKVMAACYESAKTGKVVEID